MIPIDLTGKRAVVLGASGGLGHQIADTLNRAGAQVVGTARTAADDSTAVGLEWRSLDLMNPDSVAEMVAFLRDAPVDILVNISGGPPTGAVAQHDGATWRAQFQAMVLSLVELTNAAIPAMRDQQWGRVVTVTSSGTTQPIANLGLSNTLRSSIVGWSKTLAGEVAADGVTVNLLQPGRIATSRVEQLDRAAAERQGVGVEDVRKASIASIPAGRYGHPEEFANAALFLCSDLASYVTGSMLRVDGGFVKAV